MLINWAVNIAGYYVDENTSLKNRIGAEMCHSDFVEVLQSRVDELTTPE